MKTTLHLPLVSAAVSEAVTAAFVDRLSTLPILFVPLASETGRRTHEPPASAFAPACKPWGPT